MRIISWNIYKDNRDIHKAIAFLKGQKADIICLQEFPVEHVNLLDGLGLNIALCDEVLIYKDHKKPDVKLYSVIASRFHIEKHAIVEHKNQYELVSGINKQYHHFRADSCYVDVASDGELFRIFNVHFKSVAGPYHRLSQFKEVIEHLARDRQNIICGDLNTFGKPLLNLFVWKYFGYKIHEIKMHEGKILRVLLNLYGFKNPFHGYFTFLKFPAQLDYILVPAHFDIKLKRRFLHFHGSDHFPLLLEI